MSTRRNRAQEQIDESVLKALLTQPGVICRAVHLDDETVDDAVHVELVGLDPTPVAVGAEEAT